MVFKAQYHKNLDQRLVAVDWRELNAPAGCFHQFPQRRREKSLVPMYPEISENSSDISKGIFRNVNSRFESWRPSHDK
jgi:hypothetical protein